jgi:hypothetical protein
MYDTFEGMSEPGEEDKDPIGGNAHDIWLKLKNEDKSGWCVSSLEEVKNNLLSTNYPNSLLHYIVGMVENTIQVNLPSENVSLLRLDTDWYMSTKHEMDYLFPRLVKNGILIIDDYGHWEGAKKAIDEYVNHHKIIMFLQKVDYTARIAIKT